MGSSVWQCFTGLEEPSLTGDLSDNIPTFMVRAFLRSGAATSSDASAVRHGSSAGCVWRHAMEGFVIDILR